jgi:hypothetical protein
MVVFLGKGYALWRGVVGPCPGCPEGGGGRGKGVALCSLSSAFPGKGLGTFASAELLLGPGPSSLMTPLVPGSPRPCLSFVVVLGRCNRQGPIKKSPSESDTGSSALPLRAVAFVA